MVALGRRGNRLFSGGVLLLSLLAGCGDQRNLPQCGDVYKAG